jgi:NhaC family Na+:H+ antiporter
MNQKAPSLFVSLVPILLLIGLLTANVVLFYGDNATGGPNQIALLMAAAVAGLLAFRNGVNWETILKGITKSITTATPAIIILLMIGALAGTWMLSGVIPTMIYYGLKILNPTIFLFAACIACAVISLATGSSWSTMATVGVALIGIGQVLGIGGGMIAGAIISGAYFGDKMSPLSDTTNLSPAVAGTDLFTHVRYMLLVSGPTIGITLVIFLIIGLFSSPTASISGQEEFLQGLQENFHISPWLLLVPIAVIAAIVMKIPALPALFGGTLLGGIVGIIAQPEAVEIAAGVAGSKFKMMSMALINTMSTDVNYPSENEQLAELLSTGGMGGMMGTIWLIICAMTFGGAMEAGGFLKRITNSIISLAKSDGSLIATTTVTCAGFNATASDQYLAIVVPGRMYADIYKERGLAPENLSRTLEASGTVTSVLVPYNTCGAYASNVLGVATGEYLLFCFFNYLSPFVNMAYGYLGIKIRKISVAS